MTGLLQGDGWPLLALLWPLLTGLVPLFPRGVRAALWLLPVAPLPALAFALAGAPGAALLPDLLLGTTLAAVPGGALLLGMTAGVWAVAGLHVALSFPHDGNSRGFAGFWCLTLTGNLAVFLAGDVATFYVGFAAVSLAAWVLVVHDRTAEALHAGKVYILMAIAGEAALLAGLLIGAQAAGSLAIAEVRAALGAAPLGALATALLLAGFGIKAGMVPLHLWLPLAHPAAPVPGSAVLSGAIVKAGLIGVLLFVSPAAFPRLADLVLAAGLAGAFGAAIWGLSQRNPKAVLAYSTISQMGIMLALAVSAAAAAVPLYALHHGLAKGALFLLAGVALMAASRRQRLLALALAAAVSASIAGLPFTGGSLAKGAAKAAAGDGLALAITLSGATTTALLGWFGLTVLRRPLQARATRAWPLLLAGSGLLAAGALLVPLLLDLRQGAAGLAHAGRPGSLAEAALPILAGLGLLVALARRPLPQGPTGDLLALVPRLGRPRFPAVAALRRNAWQLWRVVWVLGRRRAYAAGRRAEAVLLRWPLAGALLTATALLLAFTLRPG